MGSASKSLAAGRIWFRCLLIWSVVLISSSSVLADLLNRCPKEVPKTPYLRATEWGKCYEFHTEERTWKNANQVCLRYGGHLVTIKEERIQRFLLKTLAEYKWPRNGLWIGATDKDKEMEWRWITGELVSSGFSRWAAGQPSCGIFCFEDCAVMRWKEQGKWHDYRCNWVEDYSFVCEYDMLPEPTTVLTSTTTTTTTTEVTTTAEETVVITAIPVSSSKNLDSEYLLLGHSRENEKEEEKTGDHNTEKEENKTNLVLSPVVAEKNVVGAKEEQVQENVSSSGIDSGTLAIIIAVMASLLVGLCILLLFFRRRRRKLIREDDMGISYENPYYEESKASAADKRRDAHSDNNEDASIADETHGACGGQVDTDVVALKKGTEMKLPPSPHHTRLHCVMNNYDTPPTVKTRLLASTDNGDSSEKSHFGDEDGSDACLCDKSHMTKEEENYYDEVSSQRLNSKYTYDIPRASGPQHYSNEESDIAEMLHEQPYCNISNENIYESVDNLEAIVEQIRNVQADETGNENEKEEERYVPFAFDTINESKSE